MGGIVKHIASLEEHSCFNQSASLGDEMESARDMARMASINKNGILTPILSTLYLSRTELNHHEIWLPKVDLLSYWLGHNVNDWCPNLHSS
jgi:hypothetical protein